MMYCSFIHQTTMLLFLYINAPWGMATVGQVVLEYLEEAGSHSFTCYRKALFLSGHLVSKVEFCLQHI